MKLLVLGAGVYQLPAIRRARELGHEVHVCSRPGPYPGFADASACHHVDTTDVDACVALAHDLGVHGVLCPGTDVSLPALGAIVDALGLPGPGTAAVAAASNKHLMKLAFERGGITTPRGIRVDDVRSATAACDRLGYPSMLKAVDSSGSRGIVRIASRDAVGDAYAYCRAATRTGYLLAEEFVEGEEFGAQAFVLHGRVTFVMLHGDSVVQTGSTGVPVGHHVPYLLPEATERRLRTLVARTAESLGLDNCALNFDFIRRGDDIFVLEVGARSGATCLSEMVSAHYGLDYYEFMIDVALGRQPATRFIPGQAVAARLITSPHSGVLRETPEHPTAADVVDYRFDYAAGDRLPAFRTGPDRIGHIVVVAGSLAQAQARLQSAVPRLAVDIDPES